MALPLLPLIGLAATAYSLYQGKKASDKQEDYLQEQKEYQREQEKDARKSAYRAAMSGSLKTRAPGYMRPETAPDAPNTFPEQMKGAYGKFGAQAFQSEAVKEYLDALKRWYQNNGIPMPPERVDVPGNMGDFNIPGGDSVYS